MGLLVHASIFISKGRNGKKGVQGNALANRDDVPVRALGRFTTLSERGAAAATVVLPQFWQ